MGRQLSLAVVGADFLNKKGPTRRFEIQMCEPGEEIELRPEPTNKHDPQAIAIYSKRGIMLGYVRAERAPFIGQQMRRGEVRAIFQRTEAWGATIRVGLDGEIPTLPDDQTDSRANDWPPPMSEDADWWPDPEWPE